MDSPADDDGDSSESSIDPSQLMIDWKPDASLLEKHHDDDTSTHSEEAARDFPSKNSSHAAVPTVALESSTSRQDGKTKLAIGESVLAWKKRRLALVSEEPKQHTPEWITIRHDHGTLPLDNSQAFLTPPTARLTNKENKADYAGNYSLLDPSQPWVECVAIYDKDRNCHVLQVVDGTVTNLKHVPSEPESFLPTSRPRKRLQHAKQQKIQKPKKAASPSTHKTEYRGVTTVQRKSGISYRAQITLDGKAQYLGSFSTAEEAARKYDEVASKKSKRARLNFPQEHGFS